MQTRDALITCRDGAPQALAALLTFRRPEVTSSADTGLLEEHPPELREPLPLALHPVMTFTGTSIDLDRLADCPFGVTASDAIRPVAEALVVEMGGEPIWVPESSRALYHAALSYGANYLITLVAQATELLVRAGIEEPQRIIAPLLSASLDNSLRLGDAALTGPVARGDAESVRRQLAAIAATSEQAALGYQALARVTADRAVASGMLRPADAERLLDVLAAIPGESA